MKLPFGFYITRVPIRPEVVKEEVPVLSVDALETIYQISVSGGNFDHEKGGIVPEVFAYYSDCVKANKAHPGRMGRTLKVIRSGDDFYYAPWELKKIELVE